MKVLAKRNVKNINIFTNKELINLHKHIKDINDDGHVKTQNVTNALFVGSTAELQKLLKAKQKEGN